MTGKTDFGVDFASLWDHIRHFAQGAQDPASVLQEVCEVLHRQVPYYDWVGFYVVDPKEPEMLVLGPFVGEPTEHVRIPFGRGICGRVAVSLAPLVIQDVTQEENYLSCSPRVQSEIVVPVFYEGRFIGELDIDSHTRHPFTPKDQEFLETVCASMAPFVEAYRRRIA